MLTRRISLTTGRWTDEARVVMNKPKNLLLTAAFSLIMNVLSAQAGHAQSVSAPPAASHTITISSLPFQITAPGTYVVAGNLICPVANVSAITVSTGAVILDLKGWTISSLTPGSNSDSVGIDIQSNAVTNNITLRNGTISNFLTGVRVASPSGSTNTFVSDIHLQRLTYVENTFSLGSAATIEVHRGEGL